MLKHTDGPIEIRVKLREAEIITKEMTGQFRTNINSEPEFSYKLWFSDNLNILHGRYGPSGLPIEEPIILLTHKMI